MSKLPTGTYRHHKGKFYEVIDTVHHSETLEELVLYRTLYGKFDLWVRPLSMFLEKVEVNGKKVSRFEFVGKKEGRVFK